MLKKMAKVVDTSTMKGATVWAAILVGFFAFLRKANYTVKNPEDFDVEDDLTVGKLVRRHGKYGLLLTKTKTVQFGEREVLIWLPKLDNDICPHRAIDEMLYSRRDLRSASPLFEVITGVPLTKRAF